MMPELRVLFLVEGKEVPASRFRARQFFPELENRGIHCTLRYGYGTRYGEISRTPLGSAYKLLTRSKRALLGLEALRHDVVFFQRTAIPHTAWPECALARLHPHTVFDFDDAIWLGPGGRDSRLRRRAFQQAVGCCQWVVAGNEFLAREAAVPEKTTVLPTVIDTNRYRPAPRVNGVGRADLVVGWMGTSPNLPYIEAVLPDVLEAVSSVAGARVRIVSNGRLEGYTNHPLVEQIPWSRQDEVVLLQSFDVGLMPLPDSPLTRGKCGFKMIQYMAVGAAVVASGVGANVELFRGSGAGALVMPGESFREPVRALLTDPDARETAGARARAHAEANLSLPRVADAYAEIFRRVAREPGFTTPGRPRPRR